MSLQFEGVTTIPRKGNGRNAIVVIGRLVHHVRGVDFELSASKGSVRWYEQLTN